MYNYKAKCNRVVDGDTLILDIDMGFSIHSIHSCRMLGYDAPERKEKELNAKCVEKLESLVMGKELLIFTQKDPEDKYGRYLVSIYYDNASKSVNKDMIEFCDSLNKDS